MRKSGESNGNSKFKVFVHTHGANPVVVLMALHLN